MARAAKAALLVLAALLLVLPAVEGYVRLRTSGGLPLRWAGKGPVRFVIGADGGDDVADGSEETAIRLGFAMWERIAGSALAFEEDTRGPERARRDWEADDLHAVLFEHDDGSGLFDAGVIAITPIEAFVSSGHIADADILLNEDLLFSTDLAPGTFDVWATVTHEVGHFIGLSHSGIGASSVSPFIAERQFTPRTPAADDEAAVRASYPGATGEPGALGEIAGRVRRAGGAPVSGAHVWARSSADGRVASGRITDADGVYRLTGLPPGSYDVAAAPLDLPVSASHLGGAGLPPIETTFQPAQLGPVVVAGAGVVDAGDLVVPGDAAINVTAPQTPLVFHPGESRFVALFVSGGGVASVEVVDPLGRFTAVGNASGFQLTVDPATAPGAYDLRVEGAGGDVALTYGFLEVVPAPPAVLSVTPPTLDLGTAFGEQTVEIGGAQLDAGAVAVLGNRVAPDVGLLDAETLRAAVPLSAVGLLDVMVATSGGEAATLAAALETSLLVRDRERVSGALAAMAAPHTVFVDTLAGATLSLTARAGKGSALLPVLVVRDAEGLVLVSSDPGHGAYDPALVKASKKGSQVRVAALVVPETGRCAIELSGAEGSGGDYELRLVEKIAAADRRIKVTKKAGVVVAPGQDAVFPLRAVRGSTLSGKLSAKDGLALEVLDLLGPDATSLLDDPAVAAAITVPPDGGFVRFAELPLDAFGEHELTLRAAGGTAGTIAGSLTIKPPKSKAKLER